MTKPQQLLIASLCYIILFSVINNTMFNVSLPTLVDAFSITPGLVSWVMIGYGVVFAIGSVMYGKLADLYPVKRLIVIGLSLFSTGSIIGFFASDFAILLLGRVVQGAGASSIPALSMIVATRYFPANKRGRVFGYVASTVAFGMGVGPILGGAITAWFGWEALFLFSLGSLLGIPFLMKHLPDDQGSGGTLDVPGALLFGAGAALLFMGINLKTWLLLPSILLLLVFFLHIQRTKRQPFVRLDLLRQVRYRLLLALGFCIFCSIGGFFFTIPLMLEAVHSLNAGAIGLTMFPGAMTAAIFGSWAGRLSDRHGGPLVIGVSATMMLAGYLLLSSLLSSAVWVIALVMISIYFGFSALTSALGSYIPTTLRKQEVGIGTGLYNLINFMGSAMGPAWSSRLIEMGTGRWNPLSREADPSFSNAYIIMVLLCIAALLLLRRVEKKKQQTVTESAPG